MYDSTPDYRAMAKTAQELGYTTRELVAKRLLRKLMRDEAYLKRREARGTRTTTRRLRTIWSQRSLLRCCCILMSIRAIQKGI
jgi:hypothetical protein